MAQHPTPTTYLDAGTRSYDHYAAALPAWRHGLRQALLPIIRAETPALARAQQAMRSNALDSYFAFSANLGTHTFFMVFLPLLFWCGYPDQGRALVDLLACGVVASGVIKDLLCLPRPVSPPLQRITMSGSAALEYGFPSTHATNAISVALYIVYLALQRLNSESGDTAKIAFGCIVLSLIYALTISIGRLYCGMHGFADVIAGGALGALLAWAEVDQGPIFYTWVVSGGISRPLFVALILLAVVRCHPEPADNCPCFDDSVAFSGVVIGLYLAIWHGQDTLLNAGVPLLHSKSLVRIPLGVGIVVAWRSLTKPLLLRILPPIFRCIESLDLDLPRRYFLKASQYGTVPTLNHDDHVLPSPREVGKMLDGAVRRRGRAVSIGPQSAADVFELLAYNEEAEIKRKRSLSTSTRATTKFQPRSIELSPSLDLLKEEEQGANEPKNLEDKASKAQEQVLSNLSIVRIRYDVEVVTKLLVYAGIAAWVIEGCPMVFAALNLGPD